MCSRARLLFLAPVLAWAHAASPGPAHAATYFDGQAGTFTNDLASNPFIGTLQGGVAYLAGGVQLGTSQTAGSYTTHSIDPGGTSGWKKLLLKHVAAAGSTFTVSAFDVDAPDNVVPLTLQPTSEPGYTAEATLPFGAATRQIRITFTFGRPNLQVSSPFLDDYTVTWQPRPLLRASITAPTTVGAGKSLLQTVNVSNSHQPARDVVITVPVGEGAITPSFDQESLLLPQTIQAPGTPTKGFTADTPIVLSNGQTVPPRHAYIHYATVAAGQTFAVTITSRVPNGTLASTAYPSTTSVTSQADGVTLADTATAVAAPTLVTSSPRLRITKRAIGGTYRIGGRTYAIAGLPVTYAIDIENIYAPTDAAHAYNLVLADPYAQALGSLSGAQAYPHAATNMSPSGTINGATALNPWAGQPALNTALQVQPGDLYWTIPRLAVGEKRTFTFSVQLNSTGPLATGQDDEAKDTVTNTAWLDSAYAPQLGRLEASHDLKVGISYAGDGHYAKGDGARGVASINANYNDNPFLEVTYGDTARFFLYARADGFSALTQTLMVDKLSTHFDFTYASLPLGADGKPVGQIFYYYDTSLADRYGADLPPQSPPALNEASYNPVSTPASAVLGNGWSTSLPPNPHLVRWVAFYIPALAPSYTTAQPISLTSIPGQSPQVTGTPPSSVTAEIGVLVRPPTAACEDVISINDGLFKSYAYRTPSGTFATGMGNGPTHWGLVDREELEIQPVVPSFTTSYALAQPNVVLGANTSTVDLRFINNAPNASATDAARAVSATVLIPTVLVNGVATPVPVVGATANNGGVVSFGPDGNLTVTWPEALPPHQSANVSVTLRVPRGVADGTSFSVIGTVNASDDLCGPVKGLVSANVTAAIKPALHVVKATTHEYVNVGPDTSELEYVLSHINLGEASTRGVTVVDRLPDLVVLDDNASDYHVQVDLGARVFFSQADEFGVPLTDIDESFVLSPANFQRGTDLGGGRWLAPGPGAWRHVAVLADQLIDGRYVYPTSTDGVPRKIRINVEIAQGAPLDTVVYNDAHIRSRDLLAATSNLVMVSVSGDPSLVVDKTCAPETVANGEAFLLTSRWQNASTNDDLGTLLRELVPANTIIHRVGFTLPGQAPTPLTALSSLPPQVQIAGATEDGWTVTWDLAAHMGRAFLPLEEAELVVEVSVVGVPTGTWSTYQSQGTATSDSNPDGVSRQASCDILVANPDLWVRKLVDNPNPVVGDTVTYTVTVSNEGPHAATNLELIDQLAPELAFVAGSTRILTPGWQVRTAATDDDDPVFLSGHYRWSLATSNALGSTAPSASTATLLGGQSVTLSYRATVTSQANAGQRYDNCASATNDWPESPEVYPNSACAAVVLPLPDPMIVKAAPAEARSDDIISYQLVFSNASRVPAERVYFIERLPDSSRLPIDDPRRDPLDTAGSDVTLVSVTPPPGSPNVQVFYHTTTGAEPTFSWMNPTQNGWSGAFTSSATYIAFRLGDTLPAYAAPRTVQLDVRLRKPNGTLPLAGSTFVNCVRIQTNDPQTSAAFPNPGALTNDQSCVDTVLPGVDLRLVKQCGALCEDASDARCVDRIARIQPGDPVRFILSVTNTGTETVRGVRLSDPLPTGLSWVADSAALPVIENRYAGPSVLLDATGAALSGVSWHRVGDLWYLGSPSSADPNHYHGVGLAAGDTATLVIEALVDMDVADDTAITNLAVAATDNPGPQPEANLSNNTSGCVLDIDRTNVFVRKTVARSDGAPGPYRKGDRVTYRLEFGAEGGVPARNTRLIDYFPDGVRVIPSSIWPRPEGATLALLGDVSTTNVCPGGCVDPYISTTPDAPDSRLAGLRIDWEPMPSPANSAFRDGQPLFFGAPSEALVDAAGSFVRPADEASDPHYTTPPITGVFQWYSAHFNLASPASALGVSGLRQRGDFLVDVLDGTGQPLAGYSNIPIPTAGGSIDLEAIDEPSLSFRVRFPTAGVSGPLLDAASTRLAVRLPGLASATPAGAVMLVGSSGLLVGKAGNDAVLWRIQSDGTFLPEPLAGCTTGVAQLYRALSATTAFGHCWDAGSNSGTPMAWRIVGNTVSSEALAIKPGETWRGFDPDNNTAGFDNFSRSWTAAGGLSDTTYYQFIARADAPDTVLRFELPRSTATQIRNTHFSDAGLLRGGDALLFQLGNSANVAIPRPGVGTHGDFDLKSFGTQIHGVLAIDPNHNVIIRQLDALGSVRYWRPDVPANPSSFAETNVGSCNYYAFFMRPNPTGTWPSSSEELVYCPYGDTNDAQPVVNAFGASTFTPYRLPYPAGITPNIASAVESRPTVRASNLRLGIATETVRSGTTPLAMVWNGPGVGSLLPYTDNGSSRTHLASVTPTVHLFLVPDDEQPTTRSDVLISIDGVGDAVISPPGYYKTNGGANEGEVDDAGRFLLAFRNTTTGVAEIFAFVPNGAGGYDRVTTGMGGDTVRRVGPHCWTSDHITNGYWQTSPLAIWFWGCGAPEAPRLYDLTVSHLSASPLVLTYEGVVADSCESTITNSASIATSSAETTLADNTATATFDLARADLMVELTADRTSVAANETITYTVSVTNLGPDLSRSATVTLVPAGIAAWLRIPDGEALPPILDLAVNETRTFEVVGQVLNPPSGTVLNARAALSSQSESDCNKLNDLAMFPTLFGTRPNAWVLVDAPPQVVAGSSYTYTITYGNNGSANALATLNATLPPGTSFVSATRDGDPTFSWSGTGSLFTSRTLTPGTTEVIRVTVTTAAGCDSVGDDLTATATISAPDDTNPADDSSSDRTLVTADQATLETTLVQSQSVVPNGGFITYTAYLRAPSEAVLGPTLEAGVGAGLTILADSVTAGGLVSGGGTTVTWGPGVLGAALAPGQTTSVTFTAQVSGEGPFTASAIGRADNVCPAPPTVAEEVVAGPGRLQIVKTANTNMACETGGIAWTLHVTNTGTASANEVQVTDPLPAGATYVNGSVDGPGANASNPTQLTWSVGTLAPGSATTLSYSTLAPAQGQVLVNTAQASATVGGNASTVTSNAAAVAIDCTDGLALEKAWTAACALPGSTIEVTLTYRNRGTTLARAVVLEDWIAPAFTGLGNLIAPTDASFDAATGRLTIPIGDLAPGATGQVGFTLTLSQALPSGTVVVDRAVLSATDAAPVASNQVAAFVLVCDDGDLCTTETCSADGQCHFVGIDVSVDCDDGDLCTTGEYCDPNLGCASGVALTCDDEDPCTADSCDPELGCVSTALPDGTVLQLGVPCGAGACGAYEGALVCMGGLPVTDCDPAYGFVTSLGDTTCAPSADVEVVYILVQDATGADAGTLRCQRHIGTGNVTCDEDPVGSGILKVYDGLACPAVSP